MIQSLLVIAAIIGILLAVHWLRKQPRQKKIQSILILAAIILIGLAMTGKLHWLFAVFAAIIPLLQKALSLLSYTPFLGRLFTHFRGTYSSPDTNRSSSVETEYLSMTLDLASGAMNGTVKKGSHAGKHLSDMSVMELVKMYEELLHIDTDSVQLLEAYLERTHKGTWKEQIDEHARAGGQQQVAKNSSMTVNDARNILGVNGNATREEIIETHRRLMQKLHPDRGGNDYLATKVNQAKELLLKKTL